MSWHDSEPTTPVPSNPDQTEPTRVLPQQPLHQPGSAPVNPNLTQRPEPRPYLSGQGAPTEPVFKPVYQGQAWPTERRGMYGPPPPPIQPWHQQQAVAYTPPSNSNKSGRVIVLAAVVALLVGLIGGAAAALGVVALDDNVSSEPPPAIGNGAAPRLRTGSVSAVAASLLPSVVQLKVQGGGDAGTGSGFVIDGEGHVLTNNHVVSPAAEPGGKIQIVTDKGATASARLVGRSPAYDLAVVQVTGLTAPAVQFGRSDVAVVGQDVLAIGSPLGLAGTVTAGIVSAKNRPVTAGGEGEISYINALQTDAAINPGNSGGPLVDMNGRVIGVNSAIATVRGTSAGSSGNIGLGFAIPIDQARRTAQQLIATGKASYPVIGASVDMQFEGGAKVSGVNPASPAQKAGLRTGDVITEIEGKAVTSAEALIVAIRAHQPGENVRLSYQRDGQTRQVSVKLGQQTG
ncbi:S1C family serine protease [Kribbella deserti]|uniref:S1C family serine protease n=1 Tax=Kribbella deserti TaxID=1926257 RepID=A0ABV6QWV2_9ACTN